MAGSRRGTAVLPRPALATYTAGRAALVANANDLFDVVKSGAVEITIGERYPLRDAARAHGDLEARRTTGSSVLVP